MVDKTAENELNIAASNYSKQQDKVSELRKTAACDDPTLLQEETRLKDLKRIFYAAKKVVDDATPRTESPFHREDTEGLLRRRFFIAPSFEIYGGVGGLFDYGPPGTSICKPPLVPETLTFR